MERLNDTHKQGFNDLVHALIQGDPVVFDDSPSFSFTNFGVRYYYTRHITNHDGSYVTIQFTDVTGHNTIDIIVLVFDVGHPAKTYFSSRIRFSSKRFHAVERSLVDRYLVA